MSNLAENIVEMTRMCKACGETKPISEFHVYAKSQGGGVSYKCSPCHVSDERKRQKALWVNNPDYRERHNRAGKNYRRGIRIEKIPAEVRGDQKICKICNTTKKMDQFVKRSQRRLNTCIDCWKLIERARYRDDPEFRAKKLAKSRRSALKHRYGITPEQADAMLTAQYGRCGNRGCGKEISFGAEVGSGKLAVVDHSHDTKIVRGILCHACNVTLGHLQKDKNIVLGLVEYADKHLVAKKGD